MSVESIKQRQTASLIHHHLADLFIKNAGKYYSGAFVTITQVRVTPDLLLARIYLSVYNQPDKSATVQTIADNYHVIRHDLGAMLRHKVRRIPELAFYLDDTLDEVDKIEELFGKLKEEGFNAEDKED